VAVAGGMPVEASASGEEARAEVAKARALAAGPPGEDGAVGVEEEGARAGAAAARLAAGPGGLALEVRLEELKALALRSADGREKVPPPLRPQAVGGRCRR